MHLASQGLRRFLRGDADCLAAVHVDECGGDFAPVAKLQRALAQAASGDDGDGVGGAAVDFDEGDEALSVFSLRIVDAELLQARASRDARRGPDRHRGVRGPVRRREDIRRGISREELSALSSQSQFSLTSRAAGGSRGARNYFLRQRMPSLVISTRMPASASSARIASEALKSRAARAAFISAIFFSMSASESCPDCRASRNSSLMSLLAAFRCGPFENSLHLWTIVVVEHGEDFVELRQRCQQRRDIIFLDPSGVERGIGLAHHLEDRGLRLRGIEVIVKRRRHALDCLRGESLHFGSGARQGISCAQAQSKIPQVAQPTPQPA